MRLRLQFAAVLLLVTACAWFSEPETCEDAVLSSTANADATTTHRVQVFGPGCTKYLCDVIEEPGPIDFLDPAIIDACRAANGLENEFFGDGPTN